MDRNQELTKLMNVLRRTARTAMQAEWTGGNGQATAHCVDQFNRVYTRLKELDPEIGMLFEPLSDESSLTVVAMACRQLAAYYEDEVESSSGWGRAGSAAFDLNSFKEFWKSSAHDIEDLGEFIRESVNQWAARHKPSGDDTEGKSPDEPGTGSGQA